ncbi:retinol dehydrogenase 14 [Centrocercus urophasianus]|uniref:retinol dehydrogenase 14 n=1 Tax=Centrocercus urophasianus TaxID=9002 RepID=UPI001C652F1B|nr:retinol dehydrogenase 14 [Centrocercus urophasianus]
MLSDTEFEFQAEQAQFIQPVFSEEVLLPLDYFHGPPPDPVQNLHIFPVLEALDLDMALQLGHCQGRVGEHYLGPALCAARRALRGPPDSGLRHSAPSRFVPQRAAPYYTPHNAAQRGAAGAASLSPGARPCARAGRSAARSAAMAPAALTAALLGGGLLFAAWRWLRAAARPGARAGAFMRGKTVIITGANSGLGRAAATELLRMKARVIMGCRDRARAERAAREIRAELGEREAAEGGGGELVVRELDLASLRSVRAFCHRVLQEEPRLDVLINNAGIFQCPYMKTEDGFEMQFGVNHLGHFLLTNLLLGLLKNSAPSRIVVVSSKLYKYGEINFEDLNSEISYNKSFCYSRSKLANILFARELARRLEGTGVTVNSLHPGIVRTNLGRHVNIPFLAKPLFNLVSWAFFKTPLEGAQTSIYLASSPDVEGVSGKYFGDCKEEELLPKAMDDLVARKLWDISEVMVGLLK